MLAGSQGEEVALAYVFERAKLPIDPTKST
jgi:hypothetical protein